MSNLNATTNPLRDPAINLGILTGTLDDATATQQIYLRRGHFLTSTGLPEHLKERGIAVFNSAVQTEIQEALDDGYPVVHVLQDVMRRIGELVSEDWETLENTERDAGNEADWDTVTNVTGSMQDIGLEEDEEDDDAFVATVVTDAVAATDAAVAPLEEREPSLPPPEVPKVKLGLGQSKNAKTVAEPSTPEVRRSARLNKDLAKDTEAEASQSTAVNKGLKLRFTTGPLPSYDVVDPPRWSGFRKHGVLLESEPISPETEPLSPEFSVFPSSLNKMQQQPVLNKGKGRLVEAKEEEGSSSKEEKSVPPKKSLIVKLRATPLLKFLNQTEADKTKDTDPNGIETEEDQTRDVDTQETRSAPRRRRAFKSAGFVNDEEEDAEAPIAKRTRRGKVLKSTEVVKDNSSSSSLKPETEPTSPATHLSLAQPANTGWTPINEGAFFPSLPPVLEFESGPTPIFNFASIRYDLSGKTTLAKFRDGAEIALENILEDHYVDVELKLRDIVDELDNNRPVFPDKDDERRDVMLGAKWVYRALRGWLDDGGRVEGEVDDEGEVEGGDENETEEEETQEVGNDDGNVEMGGMDDEEEEKEQGERADADTGETYSIEEILQQLAMWMECQLEMYPSETTTKTSAKGKGKGRAKR